MSRYLLRYRVYCSFSFPYSGSMCRHGDSNFMLLAFRDSSPFCVLKGSPSTLIMSPLLTFGSILSVTICSFRCSYLRSMNVNFPCFLIDVIRPATDSTFCSYLASFE